MKGQPPRINNQLIAGLAASAAATALVLIIAFEGNRNAGSKPPRDANPVPTKHRPSEEQVAAQVDTEVKELIASWRRTPEGRRELDELEVVLKLDKLKVDALEKFQREHAISEQIAESSIKEWIWTHNDMKASGKANWNWDLDEVKAICLRNKKNGIPKEYLVEPR